MKERDFEKLVAGLRVDTEPNPAHKERLRQQMLATFDAVNRSVGRGWSRRPRSALGRSCLW